MSKTLGVSIAVLAALIALYFVVMRVAPPPKTLLEMKAPSGDRPRPPLDPGPYPTEYEEVTVSIEIPAASEFPEVWGQGGGCPHNVLMGVLQAMVGPGNGVPVLQVEPDGPAAKAGIRRLDRLGEPAACASAITNSFAPRKEARTVEWTVRRPTGASAVDPGRVDPDDHSGHDHGPGEGHAGGPDKDPHEGHDHGPEDTHT